MPEPFDLEDDPVQTEQQAKEALKFIEKSFGLCPDYFEQLRKDIQGT